MAFTVLNECTLSPLELKGQTFTEGNGRYVLKQGQPQPQTNSQVMLLRESYKMALIALKQVPDISQYLAASFNKKNHSLPYRFNWYHSAQCKTVVYSSKGN